MQFFINWVDFHSFIILESLILELIFNSFCFESLIVMFFSFFFFLLGCKTYCEGLSSQEQCKDWFQVELRRGDMMPTLRSMIAADAQPPSVQRSASVVFGDVMEIAKLMVLLIMLTLTACGLYKNRRRPQAVQPQAFSSPNSSRPPTEAMG